MRLPMRKRCVYETNDKEWLNVFTKKKKMHTNR